MPRASRICPRPGCPNLQPCETHKRATSTARGYGYAHQKHRASLAPAVESGQVICWRCGKPITPGPDWDDGHDDADRTKYKGPEHQSCNRSAGGRSAHQ